MVGKGQPEEYGPWRHRCCIRGHDALGMASATRSSLFFHDLLHPHRYNDQARTGRISSAKDRGADDRDVFVDPGDVVVS